MKQRTDMKKLFEYAGNFRYLTILSWILSALSALLALVPFLYIWAIIREVIAAAPDYGKAEQALYYGWMAVTFALLSMLVYIGALMCSHLAAFRVQANIRSRAMHHIVTLPLGFMDGVGSGKIRKIINESSAATETYLAHQLPDMAGAYVTPVGLIILLLVFDWRLGILSLVPVVAAFAVMGTMTGERMKKDMGEYQNALDTMSNEAVEYVRGIPVVKIFGQSVFSFKRFKRSIDSYEKWVIAYTKNMRTPMLLYTVVINGVFVMLIIAAMVFTAEGVTDEFLLNLIFYIVISPIISITLNKIMFSGENKMVVSDALRRIDSIMEMKSMPYPEHGIHPADNSVTLSDVSFRYKDAKVDALKHISLQINTGESIALVGPSGGGKTTLASVIARFWDPESGEVRIGGVNVRDISKEELMNTVSFVFQDSKLLKTTILENVRMAKPDASREEVLEALRKAQCEDIIAKFTDGIDTVIGAKGVYLSGGEQQRISIARVMLKNAPILILDEATAFADPDNEERIQAAFLELSKNKTVIMIAHRLTTVTKADRIYVLKDGEIVESGTHEELLSGKAGDSLYTKMWKEYNRAAKWKAGKQV